MLVYRAVFESESAPGCILVLLLVTLSVVCSRAVLCAGCRLAGCIVRGLRELSRQNIARWWIYYSIVDCSIVEGIITLSAVLNVQDTLAFALPLYESVSSQADTDSVSLDTSLSNVDSSPSNLPGSIWTWAHNGTKPNGIMVSA